MSYVVQIDYAGHVSARVSVVCRLPNHHCSRLVLAKRAKTHCTNACPKFGLIGLLRCFMILLLNGRMKSTTFFSISLLDILSRESHFHYRHFPDNKLPKPKRSKKNEAPEYIDREDRIDKSRPKQNKLKPIPKLPSITTTTKSSKTGKTEPPKNTKESKAQKPQPPPLKPLKKPDLQKAEPTKPKTTNIRKSDDEGTFPTETVLTTHNSPCK